MPTREEEESSSTSVWTWEDDKRFERAIVAYRDDCIEDRWERVAAQVPGKSMEDIKLHYQVLLDDVNRIESGSVQLPCYTSCFADGPNNGGGGGRCSKAEQERRKGIAWTEDEHRLFLLGLEKYGKGDWRSISRNFVVTRTPTQVASHAQKYFIRLNSMNKDRRRSSIHDITSAITGTDVATPPITGTAQGNGSGVRSNNKAPTQTAAIGVYGAAASIGQPMRVLAVGTPVSIAPATYGVVSGAPVTYPVPHAPSQR